MGSVTLSQLGEWLGLLLVIVGGIGTIYVRIKASLGKIVAEQMQPLSEQLKKIDLETTKNFLVRCIADIERGDKMSETEKERFWEQYEHYRSVNGNTYIKSKVERLQAEGKL